jgi:hypothetical protein
MMRILVFAALTILGIAPGHAALIDSFVLPTDGSTVTSSAVLASGTTYSIQVSGTFEIGCIGGDPCPTDAEYYVPSAGPNAGTPFDYTGFSNTSGTDVGAQINGVSVYWGPFQLSRVYSILFVGLDDSIDMRYLDSNYGDNVGSLDVSISTLEAVVPVPAAAWLFATALLGLAGIGKQRKTA